MPAQQGRTLFADFRLPCVVTERDANLAAWASWAVTWTPTDELSAASDYALDGMARSVGAHTCANPTVRAINHLLWLSEHHSETPVHFPLGLPWDGSSDFIVI